MRILKYALIGLVVVLVAIQFIPNDLPETGASSAEDLIDNDWANVEVANILKNSCYDCHSNQTKYPWYSYVAPVSWLVKKDVAAGRDELNFSTWEGYPKRRQLKKLEDIIEEVKEGHMPLPIYLIIHRDAKLSDDQKTQILSWAEQASDSVLSR